MTSIPQSAGRSNTNVHELPPNIQNELPEITLNLDGVVTSLRAIDLSNHMTTTELIQQATMASSCCFQAGAVLLLDTEARQTLVRLMVGIARGQAHTIFRFMNGEQSSDLLQCGMDLLRQCSSAHVRRAADLVIEIAALTESDAGVGITCSQITELLRSRGINGLRSSQLANQAFAFRQQQGRNQSDRDVQVLGDLWENIPFGATLRVPDGWGLTDSEIVSRDGQDVVPCKLMITRVFENIEGHEFSVEIVWSRGERWLRHICSREQISSNAAIVKLANQGLPVTANNAPAFIQFLSDFEQANLDILPPSRIANRMGWFETEIGSIFLCGHQLIIPTNATDERHDHHLTFQGDDAGDDRIAAGIHTGGCGDNWLAAIGSIEPFLPAQLALYASLAAPLLHVVGAPNCVVSFDGRTSVGKTTALMVAASCWGYPVINGGDSSPAIKCWDTTPVFIERAAALSNGIPAVVDDTKVARRSEDIVSTIYKIANGGGRGRGTTCGIAITRNIQTILISSGEDPITSYSRAGGSRARVLGLWGSPFAGHPNAAQVVVSLRDQLSEHYGHAGPHFVQFLVNRRQHWSEWRNWYRAARSRYEARAGNNAVAGRMSACFALLELAAHLAHQAIPLPFAYRDVISQLWEQIITGTDEADQGLAAMRYFISWSESQKASYMSGSTNPAARDTPNGGWLGRWRVRRRNDQAAFLATYPQVMDRLLAEGGFPAESVRRQWGENGWLGSDPGRTTLKVSIMGASCNMVAIRWDAIDTLMAGGEQFDADTGILAATGNSLGTSATPDANGGYNQSSH